LSKSERKREERRGEERRGEERRNNTVFGGLLG
jgi:hypothetical protein